MNREVISKFNSPCLKCRGVFPKVTVESLIKQAAFFSHGREPETNISLARAVISSRFQLMVSIIEKILNDVNMVL